MKAMVGIITDRPLKGAEQVKRVLSKSYQRPRFKNFFCDETVAFQLRDLEKKDIELFNVRK
jgi:hypothetical protein